MDIRPDPYILLQDSQALCWVTESAAGCPWTGPSGTKFLSSIQLLIAPGLSVSWSPKMLVSSAGCLLALGLSISCSREELINSAGLLLSPEAHRACGNSKFYRLLLDLIIFKEHIIYVGNKCSVNILKIFKVETTILPFLQYISFLYFYDNL